MRIDSVQLNNINAIEDLCMALAEPAPDRGQWVVLLGENGAGKTSVLRALALALTTPNVAVHAYGDLPAGLLRKDVDTAGCTVVCSGHEYRLSLKEEQRETRITLEPNGAALRPLVFGYGCRRGSAFGGLEAPELEVASSDIATLFSESARIYPAFGWLRRQKLLALQKSDSQVFDRITEALCSVLPDVEKIDVYEDDVWATAPALGGEVRVKALSDGYITMIGWVVDLLARWLERAEQLRLPLGERFWEEMTGIVLLDEIDLHLHPRWQLRVIPDIRRLFPRMTFVVTTHNPATVVRARPEEIWILKNKDGRIWAEQRTETPKMMTGSEIYTSYFGIPYMVPELAHKMRRYGFLAGTPARTDEEESEVHRLLLDLRAEGVDPGWEPVPREEPPAYPGDDAAAGA